MTKMRWRDSGAAAEPNRASISSAAGVSTTAPTRMALRGRVRASRSAPKTARAIAAAIARR